MLHLLSLGTSVLPPWTAHTHTHQPVGCSTHAGGSSDGAADEGDVASTLPDYTDYTLPFCDPVAGVLCVAALQLRACHPRAHDLNRRCACVHAPLPECSQLPRTAAAAAAIDCIALDIACLQVL